MREGLFYVIFLSLCHAQGDWVSDKRYLEFEGTGMQRVGKPERIKPLDRVYYRTQNDFRGQGSRQVTQMTREGHFGAAVLPFKNIGAASPVLLTSFLTS